MKITFLGAAHEVTGSCTLLETGGQHILVDCGMEQGKDIFENQELLVNPREIDCVLLTHAHIDHSGNLPLLYKNGFTGSVYATEATSNLCRIMLRDSANIQMTEAEWKNRKAKRLGREQYPPTYDINDAEGVLHQFRHCAYGDKIQIFENVQIRFVDAGHLLGSSSIEVWLTEGVYTRKLVFSGDIGNTDQPIIDDPQTIAKADYVVIESTYGDRLHDRERPDYVAAIGEYIQKTLDRGGNVVIPSFAVGRAQELLYSIREIKERGIVKGHGDFPVYLDSPLAEEATSVFMQCDPEYFDEYTRRLIRNGINPLLFPGLRISVTSADSVAINTDPTPKVIISASGMCEAGRIRHHLKHNLWRGESLVLFAGYQAAGTLGRALYEGAKYVKLFGEEISVKAEIGSLNGVSGHADKEGLLNWLGAFEEKPKTVFVNHGEDEACVSFTNCLEEEYGYNADAPYSGTEYDLITGRVLLRTEGIRVKKKDLQKDRRAEKVFSRLMSAVSRLADTAKKCEGMSNKELGKFADQIDQLADKWSR